MSETKLKTIFKNVFGPLFHTEQPLVVAPGPSAINMIEQLTIENHKLRALLSHHERRIKEMAPEKQFEVVTVGGLKLDMEHTYSSGGRTRLHVRLPEGHPDKTADELTRELDLLKGSFARNFGVPDDIREKLLPDPPGDRLVASNPERTIKLLGGGRPRC